MREHVLDNGEVVEILGIGPFALRDVEMTYRKRHPEPQPPIVQVNFGTPEQPDYQEETNEADPDYQAAHAVWLEGLGAYRMRGMIALGVKVKDWTEEKEAQARYLRQMYLEEFGETLEGSDRAIYLLRIATQSADDVNNLIALVTGQSIPTEEVIQEEIERFPSDVQRAEPVQDTVAG